VTIGALSFRFSADLSARFGPRNVLVWSLGLVALGLALLARAPVQGAYVVDILPAMLLIGVGGGVSFPVMMTFAMSDATPSNSGLLSGLVNTAAQVGGALGLAVLATLTASQTQRLLAAGAGTAAALTGGYHLAFAAGAALVLVAIVLAVVVLPGGKVNPEVLRESDEQQEAAPLGRPK
jgi:MFS family permease